MPRGKRLLPEHITGTGRAWKRRKRAELRAIERAVSAFGNGCAYTPAFGDIGVVRDWLKRMKDALSAKKWGR